MNIAVYVDSMSNQEEVFNTLNEWTQNNNVDNVSLFYSDIGHCSVTPKFSLFNCSDIWHFTGYLIMSTLSGFSKLQAVNKFKPVFLYNNKEKDVMMLLQISKLMPIIVRNDEDFEYINRVCAKEPKKMETLTPIEIKEAVDEYQS